MRIGSSGFSLISRLYLCLKAIPTAMLFPGKIRQENTLKSNFNQPGDHLASTNRPWVVTPTIRSSSGSERRKMMLVHAILSKIWKHKLRLPHRRSGPWLPAQTPLSRVVRPPKGSSEVKAGQEEKSSSGNLRFLATAGLEEKSS